MFYNTFLRFNTTFPAEYIRNQHRLCTFAPFYEDKRYDKSERNNIDYNQRHGSTRRNRRIDRDPGQQQRRHLRHRSGGHTQPTLVGHPVPMHRRELGRHFERAVVRLDVNAVVNSLLRALYRSEILAISEYCSNSASFIPVYVLICSFSQLSMISFNAFAFL